MSQRFQYHYQIGDIQSALAYLMPFVVVILIMEYVFLKPIEAYAFRWED